MTLHKGRQFNIADVEPKEEQREPLCSNKGQSRCSSLRYETVNAKEENVERAFDILFESLLEDKVLV